MGTVSIDLNSYKSKLESLSKMVDELSKYTWDNKTAVEYCEKVGIKVSTRVTSQAVRLQSIYNSLNMFDYISLIDKIQKCNYKCNELIKDSFDEYNESYQAYINTTFSNINSQLDVFFDTLGKVSHLVDFFTSLTAGLQQLQNNLNPNVNELFDHFKFGNKNYVIFGKNGAGKTTLLKQISIDLFKNAVVIPANRNVNPHTNNCISYYNNYTLNQMLEDKSALFYLVRMISNRDLKSYQSGASTKDILIIKLYNIFSSLCLDREVIIDEESLYLQGNNIPRYSLANGSDGEKSIVYIILATLLAPQHSFLFIDEPERHLNCALMRILFDKLEAERPDLRFVYLTHITDFVESRKNVELIYLEKTSGYKNWSFKKIEDYKDISLDVLLSIEGTKDDIIFCEGTRGSIDCKILECIFPDFEVMPVGSCEQVKLNTKGINGKETLFRRKAFGLIDNDYMQPCEIEALKEDKIFPIGFNEWENFLIQSEILTYINAKHLQKDLSVVQEQVINYIKDNGKGGGKQAILSDFIAKRYTRMLYATKLSYNRLEEQIDAINTKNKSELIKEVEQLNYEIEQTNDYDKLVSIVPAKMLLNTVAKGIGLSEDEDYVDLVVKHLKQDIEFKEKVKRLLGITFT